MIYAAVQHIANQLNSHLKRTNNLAEDVVMVSGLAEPDGSLASHTNNKLVITLTNIEKDSVPQSKIGSSFSFDGRAIRGSKPLYLNLNIVLSANFSGVNYPEALKFISRAIGFFQLQPMFDRQNSPDLDHRIEKLILDIENLNIQDLSNLWGILGGKYLPSVCYRVRMISMEPDSIIGQLPLAKKPDNELR